MSSEINLNERFPKLKPIKSAPSMGTLNGIGTSVYGRRAYDVETGTYIKTYCFCFIFIPLIAIRAYRVADAPNGGWSFLGREPLSKFAQNWNLLLVSLILFGVFSAVWEGYKTTEGYLADQAMEQAEELVESGDYLEAASVYRGLLSKNGPGMEASRAGYKSAVSEAIKTQDAEKRIKVVRFLAVFPTNLNDANFKENCIENCFAYFSEAEEANPRMAIQMFEPLSRMKPDDSRLTGKQESLWRSIMSLEPENPEPALTLCDILVEEDRLNEAIQCLLPHEERLGSTEGARMLGEYFLGQEAYERAYPLLQSYVDSRMEALHRAERAYQQASRRSYNNAINRLNDGLAPSSFYSEYELATDFRQEEMVNDYVLEFMDQDKSFQLTYKRYQEANTVVPVAMNLGMIQLRRAQDFSDPLARIEELNEAEQTFLSIAESAGETDQFRLFLGQVYYWLGKEQEGKALFNLLLENNDRDVNILLSLADILRDIGEFSESRALSEEAFENAGGNDQKTSAATFRSLLSDNFDEEIEWLEKADQSMPYVQVQLAFAKSKKALSESRFDDAERYTKETIEGYKKQGKTSATLNNTALAYFNLYSLSGKSNYHEKGTRLMEESLSLNPSDSILLSNTAGALLKNIWISTIDGTMNCEAIHEGGSFQMLPVLYENEAEKANLIARIQQHENLNTGLNYLDRLMLTAPKSHSSYSQPLSIHSYLRNREGLESILRKIRSIELNHDDTLRLMEEIESGLHDEEYRTAAIESYRKYSQLLRENALEINYDTRTYLVTAMVQSAVAVRTYGGHAGMKPLLEEAIQLHRKHPCEATYDTLLYCLFEIAVEDLSASNSRMSEIAKRSRRQISRKNLIAFLLEQEDSLSGEILANNHINEALDLIKEKGAAFPKDRTPLEWALLLIPDREEAENVARCYQENPLSPLPEEIAYNIWPYDTGTVLNQHYALKLLGKTEAADNVLKRAREAGLNPFILLTETQSVSP